jgi:hypothetical protein
MVPAAAARQVLLITPADQPPMRPPNVRAAQRNDLRRLIAWCVVLGASAVCLLLGYVWVRLMVVEAGYRLSVTLEREERELAVRAAAADSATQLEMAASARLGMRRPVRGEEEILP